LNTTLDLVVILNHPILLINKARLDKKFKPNVYVKILLNEF
tara:strand:+ start:33 stop:155 length:123 start_codon:yes stop_codon:yes gene_type:complete